MEKYYIIQNSDGDTTVKELNKNELLERLNEKYYGEKEYIKKIDKADTNYWGDKILIIKGEIVIPKPIKIVEEYDI